MEIIITEALPKMLFDHEQIMKQFKRDTYADSFQTYLDSYQELFSAIDQAYEGSENKEALLEEYSDAFIGAAKNQYDVLKKKSQKDTFVIDHNSILAVYVFPALNEHNSEATLALVKLIVDKWNHNFKQYTIKAGTFAEINGGFRRKLCYVTTAVCSSLGKDEDCYEIKTLKNYRDGYLSEQEDGMDLIHEYYDIAPTIVNRINKCDNSKDIYEEIYRTYLSPCISMIEKGKMEECKDLYVKMIRILQRQYMLTQS